MPWYLYFAFKQLFPTGKRCSFTTLLAIIGVILGVMVLLIVQSVMNGFGNEIRNKVIDYYGDIRITSPNGFISNPQAVFDRLEEAFGITSGIPYAEGVVMAQYGNRPAFPFIRGIDVEREATGFPIADFMEAGTLEQLDDESLLLSTGLARSLGVRVGETLEVYTPLMLESLKNDELLLPRELTVVGLFETGWYQVDANAVISTLRLMQELYQLEKGAHGLLLRLPAETDLDTLAVALHEQFYPSLTVATWRDSNRDLLWILKLEKTMLFFIIIFIVLVASFSIAIALTLSVIRKTREIGLLVAMGATPREVAWGFCLQGCFIGVVGAALGVVGAIVALSFRNDIIHTFARLTQSEAALLRFYQFADIPVHYVLTDFIVIIAFTITTATLAGLVPAWKIVRLNPSEALRYE